MDPVNKGHFHIVILLGHRDVGRQHEFLNQLLALAPFGGFDGCRKALRIQDDLGLLQLKIDAPPLEPPGAQNIFQFVHHQQRSPDIRVPLPKLRVARQNPVHVRISHPLAGADHAFYNRALPYVPVSVDFHDAGKRQLLFPRV
ncbi:hypothetical protein SDC9_177509 [bioreactor metagenome]|uniref:Uncharacterized protein n=1 Tax=bioreactor metagenome TaxID=1076179 RepID=A0A645GVK2_9ZZZZ